MNINDIAEFEIIDLSYSGYAVGKINNFIVFVNNSVPGDIVKAKIIKLKKNHAFAEKLEIVKFSTLRTKHDCPYFDEGCGGCQWLNIDYKNQLDFKQKIIKDAFKRIGGFETFVHPVIGMNNPYQYRNKAVYQCDGKTIGFYKMSSNEIVGVKKCLQQMEYNQNAFENIIFKKTDNLKNINLKCSTKGDIIINLTSIDNSIYNIISADKIKNLSGLLINKKLIKGQCYFTQKIKDMDFEIPANGFFQTNYEIIEKIIDFILKNIQFNANDIVLDLFCGSGLFSIFISLKCSYVYGIDNDNESIIYAKKNAFNNNLTNIDFINIDAAKGIKKLSDKKINIVIIDPPRNGCEKELIEDIIKINPDKIIYISCAPDTLSRDLKLFIQKDYKILLNQPFDMFPHTYHIETVVFLEK